MTQIIEQDGEQYEIKLPIAETCTYSDFLDWRKPIEVFVQSEIAAQEKELKEKAAPAVLTKDNLATFADQPGNEPEPDKKEKLTEAHYLLNTFKYFLLLFEMGAHIERTELLEVLQKSLAVFIPSETLAVLPVHEPSDPVSGMIETGVYFFEGQTTLTKLLAQICHTFRNFVDVVPVDGSPYEFTYKGEVYHVAPDGVLSAYMGDKAIPKMTTGQIITAKENRRIFDKAIEVKGDPDGALEFQMELTTVATLAMKEGESLPLNPVSRKGFIDERAKHFKGMMLADVYRLRAFFLATLKNFLLSKTTPPTSDLPSRSRFSRRAETNREIERHKNTARL